jgi:acyl-CoA synthetase (AMP-forming)/AMP-acid ligase II
MRNPTWRDITRIEDFLRFHANTQPNAPAATFDGRTRSYGQMDDRTNRIANGLAAQGVRPGERIAIIDKNDHAALETLIGARKLGAIQVAINWRLAPPEMAYIINDAQALVLFVHQDFSDKLAANAAAVSTVRKIIVFGGHPDHESFEAWLARQDTSDPGHTSDADEIALLLYTSGTTGRPKGTMLANRNILAFIHSAAEAFGTRPDGVHLICIPLFHVGSLVWSLFAMAQGNHVVGMREFDPDALIAAIPQYGVTHGMMVPAVIQMLLSRPAARTTDFSMLQGITYGGSSISAKVLLDALTTFNRDVGPHRDRITACRNNGIRHRAHCRLAQIRQNQCRATFTRKTLGQRRTDAASGSSYRDNLATDLHLLLPRC